MTGAWSEGRSHARGILSIRLKLQTELNAELARIRSIRKPWFLGKPPLR